MLKKQDNDVTNNKNNVVVCKTLNMSVTLSALIQQPPFATSPRTIYAVDTTYHSSVKKS